MAKAIDDIATLEHVFEQMETPSFLTPRSTETIDLSHTLESDEFFKFTDSHIELAWESAGMIPGHFPLDQSAVSILWKMLPSFLNSADCPEPTWVRLGTAVVFKNANYNENRFADQKVVRLRATSNFKQTGPWFDGISTVWPNGQENQQRAVPLEIPGMNTTMNFHGEAERLFYRVEVIFVTENLEGPHVLARNWDH